MRDKREGTPIWDFCEGHHKEGNKDTDRHYRMLSFLNPIINTFKQQDWLTVGDGLGREAIFLKKQKVKKVECSNIWFSDFNKKEISKRVDSCQEIDILNIEKSISTDLTLAKECLHHLDRPIYGLYNLLDISSHGLIFIEPHDTRCQNKRNEFTLMPSREDSFLLSSGDRDEWESCGNYKYNFSVREACKLAWALEFPHVLLKGFNDAFGDLYNPPKEGENDLNKFKEYVERCEYLDDLGRQNKRPYNMIICCILKKELTPEQREGVGDFLIIDKPK
jgi:hypothetical protein